MNIETVSRHALYQRINRRLAKQDEALRTTRGSGVSREWLDLGDHYVLDLSRNFVVESHLDLEDYGRELGALAAFERLEEDD